MGDELDRRSARKTATMGRGDLRLEVGVGGSGGGARRLCLGWYMGREREEGLDEVVNGEELAREFVDLVGRVVGLD